MGVVREVEEVKCEDGRARNDITVDGYVVQRRIGQVHSESYHLPARGAYPPYFHCLKLMTCI